MPFVAKTMLVIAGFIHLLPVAGVLGAAHLERLYGLTFTGTDLVILMRHRAVLFGLLGTILIYAAWRTELIFVAIGAGLISAASFIALAWLAGDTNAATARIVAADWIAVGCLMIAGLLQFISAERL